MAGALGLVRGAWVKGISLAAFGSVLLHPMAVRAEPMSVPGKFAVSASGAATYSIPISLPPGSAGMEPSLKLEYNNQSGNGLLGVGWSLAGLPSILRCSRTVAQDGVVGGVKFDANDRFCLEGQRLIVVSGTYGADGAEYRTEIDTYSRIVSHGSAGAGPAWFEVRTKSGQVMEFGHTADSQILAQGKTSARAWAASKVADSKGNYFAVRYTNDATNGQYYPVEIDYTGNAAASVAPYNKVQFVYAARPDVIPQYQAGSLVQTTVRMTDVRTFVGAALVADYKFVYEQSGPASRSRLVSVTVCEGGGSCLPATTVNWTSATASLTAPQQWIAQYVINAGWTDDNIYPRMLVDVNGDGLPDVVGFGGDGVDVSLNTGTSFGPLQNWIAYFVPAAGYQDNNVNPRMLADVNGDGLPDVVGFAATGVYVSLNTGTSFGNPQLWTAYFATATGAGRHSGGNATGYQDNNINPRMLADVNGDGLPDVVGFADSGVYVSLNTGTSFGAPQLWIAYFVTAAGYQDNNVNPRMLADVNGDGLPDVVGFAATGVYVSLNTGTSFGTPQLWIAQYVINAGWTDTNTYPRMLVDVNGDGLPDVVGFGGDGVDVSLNTGTSFGPLQNWIANFVSAAGYQGNNVYPRMLADVNGDGLPDVVGFAATGVYVSLNTGTSFGTPQLWVAYFVKNAGFSDSNTYPRMLADLNGDGLPDVVGFAATGVYASLNAGANFGPPPDIVSSLSTGLGTKTAISYLPATNKSVATKGTGTAFPLLDLSAPVFLVSQVDASNGIGGTYSSRYTYSGGRVDTRGRGFLGFAQTTIKDLQTGVVEATNYRQDFPFIGVASSSTRTLGTQILSQSASSYQFSNASGGTTISPASAPYRMWLSQNVSSSQDLDGTALPTVTTGYQYDSYGNPTQVSASTSDGFSKTTVNTYANDTTNWYLGRLIGAAVTSSTP
ncbi:FG-GAP-like repeat-containing protein [Bradyrhizobium sp. WD16]|uniref:FG-GAP-like repeat-containing protein n=1 Tax=Bradyrhizobium sp. WD16 TaxID=1521768 RepID=UPI0020A433A4|nr:FG-GAP-like repeat-containing protein [Bradyrhizobium sp. WD16]